MEAEKPLSSTHLSTFNLALVIGSFTIYTILMLIFLPRVGGAVSALLVLPVLVGGWVLGMRGAVVIGVFAILLNIVLFAATDQLDNFLPSGIPGAISLVIVGIGAGWVSDLLRTVRSQSAELERERQALQEEIQNREAAEQARRQSEQQLRTVVNNAPLLLMSVDPDLNIILIEGAVLNQEEFPSSAELVSKPVQEISQVSPELVQGFEQAQNGKRSRNRIRAGELLLDTHWIPLQDGGQELAGIVAVATNITDQVEAKQALSQAQQELEQKNQALMRTNEFFRQTLDTVFSTANRGADRKEILDYLKQAQGQFQRFDEA